MELIRQGTIGIISNTLYECLKKLLGLQGSGVNLCFIYPAFMRLIYHVRCSPAVTGIRPGLNRSIILFRMAQPGYLLA